MKRITFSHLFVFLLLTVNLRGMLGYIFRFGSPESSPTYSATPKEYFFLWNILICLMAIIVLYKTKKLSQKYVLIYFLTLMVTFACLYQAESFYVRGAARSMILYGFFFICLYSNGNWIEISQLNRAIEFMAAFGLLFILYQIYQFKFFNILPSHSHINQSIRYGSFYNDSLILGVLLPMFAGYFINKYKSNFYLLVTAIIICLVAVLTGSLTAMGIVFIYLVWKLRKRYALLFPFLMSVLLFSICFMDKIIHLWSFKAGSIAGHLEGLIYLKSLEPSNLTGFNPLDQFIEIGYLSFLYNFGIPILVIFLLFNLVTLRSCHIIRQKSASNREMYSFVGATEGLGISVLLANLNLPIIVFPPIYLIFAIFSAIIIKRAAYIDSTINGSLV